jgi:hypothetical protein
MEHAVNEEFGLMENVIAERILGRELLRTEYVVHIDGEGLNNQRANLMVRPFSDIDELLTRLPGVIDQRYSVRLRKNVQLEVTVMLNGTEDAWAALALLHDACDDFVLREVEPVDGISFWTFYVPRTGIEDFAVTLRDVVAAHEYAEVMTEARHQRELAQGMPPGASDGPITREDVANAIHIVHTIKEH